MSLINLEVEQKKLYESFLEEHKRTNKEPIRPEGTIWQQISRILNYMFIWSVAIAALLVSASHTIPLFLATVPDEFTFLWFDKQSVGLAAFLMVEGFLLRIGHTLAQKLPKIDARWYWVSAAITALTLAIANLYGVFSEGAELEGQGNEFLTALFTVTRIAIAFIAPATAILSGVIQVDEESKGNKALKEKVEQYNIDLDQWLRGVEEAWPRHRNYAMSLRLERVVQKEAYSSKSPSQTTQNSEQTPVQGVQNVQKITLNKSEQKVKDAIESDPELAGKPQRVIAGVLEVSPGTVNSALKKMAEIKKVENGN